MGELLEKSCYVDDLLTGESSDKKAFTIYQRAKKLMAEGGFNFTNLTNSPDLQRAITESEGMTRSISTPVRKVKKDNESHVKSNRHNNIFVGVLGMNWNTNSDEFNIFSFSELSKYASSLLLTKRSILKVTTKIYDPMGFLSPLSVELKIMFQELCINKTNWDVELKGELLKNWKSILQDLSFIDCYCISHCYFAHHPVNEQFMLEAPTTLVKLKFDWSLLTQELHQPRDRQILVWNCWEL